MIKYPKLFSDSNREQYLKLLRHELHPHVYATSAASYRGLRDYNRNQSILVSGESGAGKTETVKILMGHLAHISGRVNDSTIDKVLVICMISASF
jgi:myosin-5